MSFARLNVWDAVVDEDAMMVFDEPPATRMSGGRQERDACGAHARREHP